MKIWARESRYPEIENPNQRNNQMYFSNIKWQTTSQRLYYNEAKDIWDSRGYKLKHHQTPDDRRLDYRRLYPDIKLYYNADSLYGPAFVVAYEGWSYRSLGRSRLPVILYILKDKYIIPNISRALLDSDSASGRNDNKLCRWTFHRVLDRLGNLLDIRYINRTYDASNCYYAIHLPNYGTLANEDNHVLAMTNISHLQSSCLAVESWRSNDRNKYSFYMEVNRGSTNPPGAAALQKYRRPFILWSNILKQYCTEYTRQLLGSPVYLTQEYDNYPAVGDDCCNWLTTTDNYRERPNGRVLANRDVATFDRPVQPTSTPYAARPVVSTYLYNSIHSPTNISRGQQFNGSTTNRPILTYASAPDFFGYGLDSTKELVSNVDKNALRVLKFDRIRAFSSADLVSRPSLVAPGFGSVRAYHRNYHTHEDIARCTAPDHRCFIRHIVQSCLGLQNGQEQDLAHPTMCDDIYSNIPKPSGFLIGAILHKAGSNPDYMDFILRHYFGDKAVDGLYTTKAGNTFNHPVLKLLSGKEELPARNIVKDLCGIVSGRAVINYVNLDDIMPSELAIEGSGGYRALVDSASYADVIPVIKSKLGNKNIDNYREKYASRLTKCFKSFVSPAFSKRWARHLQNLNDNALRAMHFDISTLLHDYLSGVSNYIMQANDLPLPFNSDLLWISGLDGVKLCNLSLDTYTRPEDPDYISKDTPYNGGLWQNKLTREVYEHLA